MVTAVATLYGMHFGQIEYNPLFVEINKFFVRGNLTFREYPACSVSMFLKRKTPFRFRWLGKTFPPKKHGHAGLAETNQIVQRVFADLRSQVFCASGEVDGRCLDVGVSHHLGEAVDVAASFEHERGEGVT